MPKMFTVEASVHKMCGSGYRVKVSILDLGIYINGVMVLPPNDDHDWSVYPPSQKSGKGWAKIVEFNKNLPLWEHVYEACIDAVKIELGSADDSIDVNEYDNPITIEDIPF